MFTGLIEEIGEILKLESDNQASTITVKANKVLKDVKIGDSIATNGACLTVVKHTADQYTVEVMAETMRKTNLNKLKTGDKVNLERALRVGDRLGGHIVSGHIDGVGTVASFQREDNAIWVTVETSKEVLKYIIYKGSITIDGISLTVASVDDKSFKVSLIPLTSGDTTLAAKKIGEEVNLECDIIGKYVEKLMGYSKPEDKKDISMNLLRDNGFL